MNKFKKLASLFLALILAAGILAGCQPGGEGSQPSTQGTVPSADKPELVFVDYVAETKLDLKSETKKVEATVKSYVDGDTTHFNVSTDVSPDGVLKARYLCVNTPESTGKIEEWGKKASSFTKEKLMSATSIIVESNDDQWHVDSTGGRHLVWVWYRTSDSQDYRCLNLELIQNGLSIVGGNVSERYGSACVNAFQQAKAQKLNVHSGQKDPDFFYGDAYEVTLKGLRTNIELYDNKKVAFEGVVTYNNSNTVYVESYDSETDMYYGISVYYGFETGTLLTNLKVGNLVRVVGTVTYYETGGTWQVSGLTYRDFKPMDPGNTIKLEEGHEASNRLTDPTVFNTGKLELDVLVDPNGEQTQTKTFDYAALAMNTSVSMKDLYVKNIYTTNNGGDSDGAMTLTCQVGGQTITVRTIVLRDENGNILTESAFLNKTIDVTGIVDYFSGDYQIKVFTTDAIQVHE